MLPMPVPQMRVQRTLADLNCGQYAVATKQSRVSRETDTTSQHTLSHTITNQTKKLILKLIQCRTNSKLNLF